LKRFFILFISTIITTVIFVGCGTPSPTEIPAEVPVEIEPLTPELTPEPSPDEEFIGIVPPIHEFTEEELAELELLPYDGPPLVYMTTDISPEGLIAVYEALGVTPTGNIAIKVHTGEPPNSNYLRPELIKDLVQTIGGTIVETNAVAGRRASNAKHLQVAKDHGFTAIADFALLDMDGEISIPVNGGEILTENFVGAAFPDYDYYVILSHFKGHASAGYGGAIKNIAIGIASAPGKSWIHSGGKKRTGYSGDQDSFLKAMAEAGQSIVEYLDGNLLYINVMNRLSVDCDCMGNPREPDMHDIGILASLDPVALDQACVDLIYAAPDGQSLINRIESRNGLLTLAHAENIGLGRRDYVLVSVD
jgi:uncharacterized Fe-S center protein